MLRGARPVGLGNTPRSPVQTIRVRSGSSPPDRPPPIVRRHLVLWASDYGWFYIRRALHWQQTLGTRQATPDALPSEAIIVRGQTHGNRP